MLEDTKRVGKKDGRERERKSEKGVIVIVIGREYCRFSNCDETGHQSVALVSYDGRTTDDDDVPS